MAIILAVMGMGGPSGAAAALTATINYFLAGTPWEAPDWLTAEGLLPLRAIFFLFCIGILLWALWPTRTKEAPIGPATSQAPSQSILDSAAYARLEMLIGPRSTLSPESRLNQAYAEFHRLTDEANRGDAEAAKLAAAVAPWVRAAAKFYHASSEPAHRIERSVLLRLGQIQSSPAASQHVPPTDPDEIERGRWELHFNPGNANAMKAITFLPSGQIGEGRNHNEATWTLDGSLLTIRRTDRSLQNEFIYVPGPRYFACTNRSDARGIANQTISRR